MSKLTIDERLDVALKELDEARYDLAQPPEWGNCRRGCMASYLDREGYCSPACHRGAPKGEHVTIGAVGA